MKQGLTTFVPRKVVKADWEDNFGQLLTIVEPGFEGKVVDKILISPNERFADPLTKYRSQRLCQCVIRSVIACTITSRVKG